MSTPTHPAAAPRADPDFRRYLASRVVAVTGSLVSLVAMPVLVYQLSGSPAWTAAVAAASALPYLLLGLPAGALADRADRRALMVGADLVAAAALATVPLAWWAGALTAGHVVAVALVVQCAFVFFDAAAFGALPVLVGRERLTEAYSTVYGATTAVELVVPALAGLLVAVVAPAPLIGVNAATALGAALLVRAVRRPLSAAPATPAPVRAAVAEGLRFIAAQPVVRTLTLVGTANAVAGGAWAAMLVPWADRALGVAPSGDPRLALLFACSGVGGVAASRLVPALTRRWGGARLALVALPVAVACGALVASAGQWGGGRWAVGLVGATAWGVAHGTVVLNAITYRQRVCPADKQARVNTTARMLSWGLGAPAGAALAGVVAVGPAGPAGGIGAGVAVLAAGAVLAWAAPALRGAVTARGRQGSGGTGSS